MSRKRDTAEQIISKHPQAEVLQSNGQSIVEICRQIGIKEQTYYKWHKEYGGIWPKLRKISNKSLNY